MSDRDRDDPVVVGILKEFDRLRMRDAIFVAAIDKLSSVVDTNNELLARMIAVLHAPTPPR